MGSSGHDANAAQKSARTAGHRYPKQMRLRRRRQFLAVQDSGRAFHGRYFLAVVEPRSDGRDAGRLGITVSKKIGKAVVRNRVKRLVREYVRQNPWLPPGRDVVVIAKRGAASLASYADAARDLAAIGSKIGQRGSGRPERPDRPARSGRPERPGRPARSGRPERQGRSARGTRSGNGSPSC